MIKVETMERNVTLDFVRGVAILGILLLNISAFGLPKAAYLNPAWYGAIVPEDAWSWAILDIVAQAKFLTLFALLFGAGLQMLLPRGKQWIQSRLTLLVLLGFIHALFFWDGDILLAYGLVGLICWRLIRDAPSVKSLFNTGILLYLVGIGVLLLLGVVSSSETSRAWTPDASAILYEKLLEMRGINKSFPGVKALDNVNLNVRPHSIHALMGENGAGKSTLLKCLFGIYQKDSGSIVFQGKEVDFHSAKEALENGISMVHQELNLVLQRSVMDNMWLGRYPTKGMFVDQDKMYQDTKAIFDELDIDIDPRARVGTLSVSQMQMIEIAKAFSYNAKIVIMDEPTSSLTEKEVNHLFTIIRKLKERGCGIVYISHKMEEIFQLCDEITILRDGQWIATQPLEGLDMDKIIAMMVGRSLNQRFPDKENKPGDVILEVRHLTSLRQPSIRDVSFDLHKGEILGIAGLVGAKRTDIVETLFGIREKSSGTITLHGKKINNHTANEAINHGFALVTEERRSTGIYAYLDIGFNSLISNIRNYKNKVGLLDNSRMKSDTQWVIDSMRVKTPGHRTQIGSLSGGNQQKVIIGRWLLTQPEILMLDEPTRGIDVGAKFEIYQLIAELAKKGKGIIIISSEMPELLGITDRILVMSNGLVSGIVDTKTTTQNEILRLASLHL